MVFVSFWRNRSVRQVNRYVISIFLSLIVKLTLPGQAELINCEALSIKYYDRMDSFVITRRAKLATALRRVTSRHLWPVLLSRSLKR